MSLSAAGPAAADPVGIADLRLLVEGGVGEAAIVRHLERWGLERDLAATDLVALRRAGATESLLAALAGRRGLGTPGERSVPLAGGSGLLLTNLDEQGRRLGGEVPEAEREAHAADAIVVEAAPEEEPPEEPWTRRSSPGRETWREDHERLGTPGGYTHYKLYHSSRPDDGFRTWVLPTYWQVRPAPFLPPVVVTYFPPYLVF